MAALVGSIIGHGCVVVWSAGDREHARFWPDSRVPSEYRWFSLRLTRLLVRLGVLVPCPAHCAWEHTCHRVASQVPTMPPHRVYPNREVA